MPSMNLTKEEIAYIRTSFAGRVDSVKTSIIEKLDEAEMVLPEAALLLGLARDQMESDDCEIDDDAVISAGADNGVFIQSWVWLPLADTIFDRDGYTPSRLVQDVAEITEKRKLHPWGLNALGAAVDLIEIIEERLDGVHKFEVSALSVPDNAALQLLINKQADTPAAALAQIAMLAQPSGYSHEINMIQEQKIMLLADFVLKNHEMINEACSETAAPRP